MMMGKKASIWISLLASFLSLPSAVAETKKIILQNGHIGRVYVVEFSHDGRFLATGGFDRMVKVWDTKRWDLVAEFIMEGSVSFLDFSPDDDFLAIYDGGHGGTLTILEWRSGREALKFRAGAGKHVHYTGCKGGGAVSIDAAWSKVAFNTAPPQIYKLVKRGENFELIEPIRCEGPGCSAICMSPDGRLLVGGIYRAGRMPIWDCETGKLLRILEGGVDTCWTISFPEFGKHLMAVGMRNSWDIWVFDAKSFQVLKRLLCGGDAGSWFSAFSNDGRWLAINSGGWHVVKVFDTDKWEEAVRLNCDPICPTIRGFGPRYASFSPDGELLAVAYGDGIGIFKWREANLIKVIRPQIQETFSVRFSPDGNWLACGSFYGSVWLWKRSADYPDVFKVHDAPIRTLAFSNDGKWLASGDEKGFVSLLDILGKRLLRKHRAHNRMVADISFSPTKPLLATASWDGMVRIWNVPDMKLLQQIEMKPRWQFTRYATSVCFSPNGKFLAIGKRVVKEGEWSVEIFETGSWKPFDRFGLAEKHGGVRSLSFSPDGKYIAALTDKSILIWDVERRTLTLEKEADFLKSRLCWQPDGKAFFYTNCREGGVGRLSISGEAGGYASNIHAHFISDVSLSPDGKLLATSGMDGLVKVWKVGEDGWIKELVLTVAFPKPDAFIAFIPEGFYKCSKGMEGCIRILADGNAFEPNEFAYKFNWQNEPEKVRLP